MTRRYRRIPRQSASWKPSVTPYPTSQEYIQWGGNTSLSSTATTYTAPVSSMLIAGTFTLTGLPTGVLAAAITIFLKDGDGNLVGQYQWDACQNAQCLTFFVPKLLNATNMQLTNVPSGFTAAFNPKLVVCPP